jgi:hypothetical protein
MCNGHAYSIKLHNVLHIPSNRNNLLSLGRLDAVGGSYNSANGTLSIISVDCKKITEGIKVSNNLYKMRVMVHKHSPKNKPEGGQVFVSSDMSQTWEVWHRHFGHIGYGGLKCLHQNKMVDGLTIDIKSSMPDCVACMEAKQYIELFDKGPDKQLAPGDLTHIDLWGKYELASINGNQYYIVLIDDATQFITVDFLKTKDQASTKVKNYLAYLKTQG